MEADRLRSLVQDCVAKHLYSTAAFYADKLVSLTQHAPGDVYLLAQTFFVARQYRRAALLLKHHGMLEDVRFRYLTAKCLAEVKEWDECLSLLGDGELDDDPVEATQHGYEVSTHAAVCLLRGQAFEALDNRQRAIACYTAALRADPYCQEAFSALVGSHMLTNSQELELVDSLPFQPQDRWLALLYRAQCKKYLQHGVMEAQLLELQAQPGDSAMAAAEPATPEGPSPTQQQQAAPGIVRTPEQQGASGEASSSGRLPGVPGPGFSLGSNPDVLACRADWLFHLGRYEDAYQLTSGVLALDPFAAPALTTHLSAALQLGKRNELFLRGHKLVEEYPDSALAWFGVGAYYMAAKQYEAARRFFAKATQLDKGCAAAWIGFGHAFAEQDESDQALAAYRTASRLFPGLHTPLLGMGCAYARMNNLHLCERCLLQAHGMCPHDPAVAHELGVLAYKNEQYADAAEWLAHALELLPGGRVTPAWEATVLSLAHACRKLRRWERALQLYEQAIGLNPNSAASYAGLGYTQQLMGDAPRAVESYHKALGLRPDDAFAAEMLGAALADLALQFGAELEDEGDLPDAAME